MLDAFVNKDSKTPRSRWVQNIIDLARPGVMIAMFFLIVFGGLIFGAIELFNEGAGHRSMLTFVGFFAAMNEEYYETLRFIFGAYVLGRSGQEIAKSVSGASATGAVAAAQIAANATPPSTSTVTTTTKTETQNDAVG